MFTRKRLRVLFALPVLFAGCTHGFNRDALRERLNDGTLQSPDAAIAEVRALKPQLRFPCRIAVYLKPGEHDWRWTADDKAAMDQWAATLKKDGIAADVFPLPELLAGKGDMKELRLAAAKCGADVLFVVHGAAQTDSYKNVASVFDITIVGAYVVPSSHRDSLFLMEGVLVDVDNGYVYAAVQAEGEGKIVRPTFVVEDRDAVSRAKAKAVAGFGTEVVTRLRALASTPLVSRVVIEGNTVTAGQSFGPQLGVFQGQQANATGAAPDPGSAWRRDTRLDLQNAGGVMTGITAPQPVR